jgi:murein DD-endopeptidase MepM/ murein hydrolase activator NlpD
VKGKPGCGHSDKGGDYVIVNGLGDDPWTLYLSHLEKLCVKPGDIIKAGQLLGLAGRQGNAKYMTSKGWKGCVHIHMGLERPRGLHPNRIEPVDGKIPDHKGVKVDVKPYLVDLYEADAWRWDWVPT